jgi:hypothetical protein
LRVFIPDAPLRKMHRYFLGQMAITVTAEVAVAVLATAAAAAEITIVRARIRSRKFDVIANGRRWRRPSCNQ